MPTPEEFKQKILQKYPQGISSDGQRYSQMDATELTKRIVAKYPDGVDSSGVKYSDYLPQKPMVQTPPTQHATGGSFFDKIGGAINATGHNLGKLVGALGGDSAAAFGKTIGGAIASPTSLRSQEYQTKQSQDMQQKLVAAIKKNKAEGKQTATLERQLRIQQGNIIGAEQQNPAISQSKRQIIGQGLGVGTAILSAGLGEGAAAGVEKLTMGGLMKGGAKIGGIIGGSQGLSQAMQENKGIGETALQTGIGAVGGAALGAAGGWLTGKLSSKILDNKGMAEYVSERLTPETKTTAYKAGKLTEAGLVKSEKFTPAANDLERAQIAKESGITGKSFSKDISAAKNSLSKEAESLKKIVGDKKILVNPNIVTKQLNKMRDDATTDLIPDEEKVYDKMISKFQKILENNKGDLGGLLKSRQEFDAWAKSNNPNIFDNQRGGAYRALKSTRDSINDYIDTQVGNNKYKESLKKQSHLYDIIDNISEKASKGDTKLKASKLTTAVKRVLPYAAGSAAGAIGVGGAYEVGKKVIGQ